MPNQRITELLEKHEVLTKEAKKQIKKALGSSRPPKDLYLESKERRLSDYKRRVDLLTKELDQAQGEIGRLQIEIDSERRLLDPGRIRKKKTSTKRVVKKKSTGKKRGKKTS